MEIKKIWKILKESSCDDKDIQRAFRRSATPNVCIELLEEIERLEKEIKVIALGTKAVNEVKQLKRGEQQ
jgi:hypothetical protein